MKNKTIKIRNKEMSLATTSNYETDFYKWTKNQSSFLEKGDFKKLDIANLKEEIESLGRSERRALLSHIINLLMHLLKKEYQSKRHTKSWDKTTRNARFDIKLNLSDNPSLKRELPEIFKKAYKYALKEAVIETGLPISAFPKECPWTLKEVLGE